MVIFVISESPYCRKPSFKFLLKRIYGLEDVVWYKQPCLWGNTQPIYIIDQVSQGKKSGYDQELPQSQTTDGTVRNIKLTKYVVWRITRQITSICPSLISEKNCSSHSEFILPGVSHQVSAQEDIWFGRSSLQSFMMAVYCWALFYILMKWFQLFCVTYLSAASHQVSVQEDIWFGRWWCLKKSRIAV